MNAACAAEPEWKDNWNVALRTTDLCHRGYSDLANTGGYHNINDGCIACRCVCCTALVLCILTDRHTLRNIVKVIHDTCASPATNQNVLLLAINFIKQTTFRSSDLHQKKKKEHIEAYTGNVYSAEANQRPWADIAISPSLCVGLHHYLSAYAIWCVLQPADEPDLPPKFEWQEQHIHHHDHMAHTTTNNSREIYQDGEPMNVIQAYTESNCERHCH